MKLSTKVIKNLISEWVSTVEFNEIIVGHYAQPFPEVCSNEEMKEFVEETAESFNFKNCNTQEDLEQRIWNLWKDGSNWKRVEKNKLKENGIEWFRDINPDHSWNNPEEQDKYIPGFIYDVAGWSDYDLVKYYFENTKLAEKCIHRMFFPPTPMDDNYRLEIITTPDDEKIVGWVVIVD